MCVPYLSPSTSDRLCEVVEEQGEEREETSRGGDEEKKCT